MKYRNSDIIIVCIGSKTESNISHFVKLPPKILFELGDNLNEMSSLIFQ